jgi:DNA-binding transcriptional MerR regulator
MPDTAMPETKTIGEVCAEFGVTPRALRFYEAKGLLSPIREGQKRLFTNRCLARLKLILQGKRFGFSLGEIKALLDLYHVGDGQVTQLSATLEAAERHHAELVAQRDELGHAIAELEGEMDQIRRMLEAKGARSAAE